MAGLYSIAIDLSSDTGTLALLHDGHMIEERVVSTGRDHSERLIVELKSLLEKHSVGVGSVQSWLSTAGPGSFTGLRIGFAALKAFAMATNSKIEIADAEELRALAGHQELRASDLIHISRAKSRKVFASFDELVMLSPVYTASKFD